MLLNVPDFWQQIVVGCIILAAMVVDQIAKSALPVISGMTPPAVEVRGLAKSYGAVRALRGVSLQVCAGEVLGLVGDNGAGKTTLVRCIAGMHRADAGEIRVDGRAATATPSVRASSGSRRCTRTSRSSTRSTSRTTSSSTASSSAAGRARGDRLDEQAGDVQDTREKLETLGLGSIPAARSLRSRAGSGR